MNSFSSFLFIKCLPLVLILILSSCENTVTMYGRESLQKKATRFEQFTTHSSSFSCGITFDKQLFCNEQRVESSSSMFALKMNSHWPAKKVGTGRSHICTIFEGPAFDEIWCKGIGTSGQLGDGLNKTSDVLVKVLGLPETRFIDLGFSNLATCVSTASEQVYCWGTGYFPTNVASPSPTAILTPLTGVKALKGNYSNMCALKSDQSLWCWGAGSNGILAQGNATHSYYIPRQVKDTLGSGFLANVAEFSVGYTNMCAIVSEEVYCWGFARRAGVDQDAMISLPRHLTGLSGAVKIESGDYHTCALLKTGEVYCWGQNRSLQIGGTDLFEVITPKKVDFPNSVGKIVNLSLGNGTNPTNARSCVLNEAGEVYCWGTASQGTFGSSEPLLERNFRMQPLSQVSSLKFGQNQLCLINNGKAYSSGFNDYAQFNSDRHIVSAPMLMSEDEVSDFSCGRYANCYVSSNKLFCQGLSYTNRHEITALGNTVHSSVLASHTSCALMENNDLNCWGTNSAGQVGNGSVVTPVAITSPYLTMTDVLMAKGSFNIFCAVKLDKTVWCWGSNAVGSIGHDNSLEINVTTPAQVVGLPDLSSVSKIDLKIEYQSVCLQADKDMYCWGAGIGGLLNLETENTYKAQKIEAFSGKVQKIAMISSGVCVSYSDNSINCLTRSSSALGIFENKMPEIKKFNPVGVIKDIEGGTNLLCANLTNGKLYCLGSNVYGGMNHSKVKHPLVLNPEKWIP